MTHDTVIQEQSKELESGLSDIWIDMNNKLKQTGFYFFFFFSIVETLKSLGCPEPSCTIEHSAMMEMF